MPSSYDFARRNANGITPPKVDLRRVGCVTPCAPQRVIVPTAGRGVPALPDFVAWGIAVQVYSFGNRGHWWRDLVLYLGRRDCGLNLRELGAMWSVGSIT